MSSDKLCQVRQEVADQSINKTNDLMEKWEKRLTLANLRLAERFGAGEINFLIHFRRRNSVEEYVLCLKPIVSFESIANEQAVTKDSEIESVFVDVVQLVQTPERIVPALVRLEMIDSFYGRWPHSLYFSNLRGFVVLGVANDWEGNPIARSGAGCSNQSKLISQMVERTSEILNDVSCNGQQLKRGDGILSNVRGACRHLNPPAAKILIGNDYLVCNSLKGIGEDIELQEVLFGPFDFHAD